MIKEFMYTISVNRKVILFKNLLVRYKDLFERL